MGFVSYVKTKRYEIIVGIVGFLLATVIIGTILAVVQESLKQRFLGTRLRIKSLATATGVFPSTKDLCIKQVSSYEISATDFVKDLNVSIIFPEGTKIVSANVVYTVALSGFTPSALETNSLELKLSHHLDAAKRAQVFVITERPFRSSDQINSQPPDIHAEGKDKNGNVVYQ